MAKHQARRKKKRRASQSKTVNPERRGTVVPVSFPPDQYARLERQIRTGDSKSAFIRRCAMSEVEKLEGAPVVDVGHGANGAQPEQALAS